MKNLIVHSDALRIKQVLVNLLDNSIKFTEEGKIIFAVEKKKDKLEFSVKDTGTGIKTEDQEKVFEQFIKFNYQNWMDMK